MALAISGEMITSKNKQQNKNAINANTIQSRLYDPNYNREGK